MLFSELNQINLNVLLQDTKYESVPDLSACVIHNKKDWTLFVKHLYAENDKTVVNLNEPVHVQNGWGVNELYSENLEDAYLNYALTEISNNVILASDDNSDIVKIYTGEFEKDGTINYECLVDGDELFSGRSIEPHKFKPIRGWWWTFNNGAFQWCNGGPKSIFECRYSYGPFNCPDPHHHDTNHEMVDHYFALSLIPNLIFVFDEYHVLKGIVSLPCVHKDLRAITKNYIENLLAYSHEHYTELSFKNMDTILYQFSQEYAYIPMIRVAKKHAPPELSKPVKAMFELENNEQTSGTYKFITRDNNKISTFLQDSIWSIYSVKEAFEDVSDKKLYTLLGEHVIFPSIKNVKSTIMFTLSDVFKQTKEINKLVSNGETNVHFIVLPTDFCNKEFLKFISNVKYLE